jgi:hypothetical protein
VACVCSRVLLASARPFQTPAQAPAKTKQPWLFGGITANDGRYSLSTINYQPSTTSWPAHRAGVAAELPHLRETAKWASVAAIE